MKVMEQTFGLDLSRKFMTTAEIKKISQNKKKIKIHNTIFPKARPYKAL